MSIARQMMMASAGGAGGGAGEGWNLATATYDSVSFDASAQGNQPSAIALKPDGTSLYMAQNTPRGLYQYSLSTADDIGSATYSGLSADPSRPSVNLAIKDDGSTVFALMKDTRLYSFALTTPFNISTLSSSTFQLLGGGAGGMDMNPAGTKMYFLDSSLPETVRQYSLSTAWDRATLSLDAATFDLSSVVPNPTNMRFKPDESRFFVLDRSGVVYQFDVATPGDISTASYSGVSFDASSQLGGFTFGLGFNAAGTKMYISSYANVIVYQYSLTD